MPMDTRTLVAQRVVYIGNDSITLGPLQRGQRPMSIDADGSPLGESIWVRSHPGDVPVIVDGRSPCM